MVLLLPKNVHSIESYASLKSVVELFGSETFLSSASEITKFTSGYLNNLGVRALGT